MENTLMSQLRSKKLETNKYELSGVYWLKCGECPCMYIGKRDDCLKRDTKNTFKKSKTKGRTPNLPFTYKIQDKCRNMEETLDVLHIQSKGRMMNTLENYHMYKAHIQGIQLNEALTKPYNPIFEVITGNQLTCNFSKPYNQTPPVPTGNSPV
jgi:hypothetical protein